ncbi:DUF296 domain-containing protein [Candidatus Berkelbacteria bacterium]|nr:DUF296 domain-containing protein [Candidatus Berkelbacteria bacterium]
MTNKTNNMTYKKFGHCYVVRLYPGEEVKESIRQFCLSPEVPLRGTKGDHHRLTNVWFFGIGAVGECELNFFDLKTKKYSTKKFKQELEIASLQGNVTHDGIVHVHGVFSDRNMKTIAGHIERAVISVTGEIILLPLSGTLKRTLDQVTGLKLIELE